MLSRIGVWHFHVYIDVVPISDLQQAIELYRVRRFVKCCAYTSVVDCFLVFLDVVNGFTFVFEKKSLNSMQAQWMFEF